MNIRAITSYNQNFQARYKVKKITAQDIEKFEKLALGATAIGAGASSIGDGAFSLNLAPDSVYKSTPDEVLMSHDSILNADNNGKAVPVQSTVFPLAMTVGGFASSNFGSNALENALSEKVDVQKTPAKKEAVLNAESEKKYAQTLFSGASYLGAAAASLYSGFDGEHVNQMLPDSLQSAPGLDVKEPALGSGNKPHYVSNVQDCAPSSALSGIISLGVPSTAGSYAFMTKASDMKSSQFVVDTYTSNKNNKKIPT